MTGNDLIVFGVIGLLAIGFVRFVIEHIKDRDWSGLVAFLLALLIIALIILGLASAPARNYLESLKANEEISWVDVFKIVLFPVTVWLATFVLGWILLLPIM